MPEIEPFDIVKLSLGPKDILVARLKRPFPDSATQAIGEQLKAMLGYLGLPNIVVVVESDMELAIIQATP